MDDNIPNHWNAFNLRATPFFQDTLGAGSEARYPIELFVGRDRETDLLLRSITGSLDSRQAVVGEAGYGKTTLVQYVKYKAASFGYVSNTEPVSVTSAESADELLIRILSYVYDTLYSFSKGKLAKEDAMQRAQQLVLTFRVRNSGGSISASLPWLPIGGGVGKQTSTTYHQSSFVRPIMVVPKLLTELLEIGRKKLKKCRGILVHLNNLENLSDADGETAGRVLRDIRDMLLKDGYHYLLVGIPEAIRLIIAPHAQLRSVFMVHEPLEALTFRNFEQLLGLRYTHLRLDQKKRVIAPVESAALQELYALFAGDLRGVLSALDYASSLLIGYTGSAPASPMTAADIRTVLRVRYRTEADAQLSEASAHYLESLASNTNTAFTQGELVTKWEVSQAFVSKTIAEWQRYGYVREAGREARRVTYTFTGRTKLMLG